MRKVIVTLSVLLVLAPVVLITTLLYTELGVAIITRRLTALEGFALRVEGVSGTLAGPLHIERFELDHPRVHIVSHDIHLTPQLRGLLVFTVQVGSLTARDTSVTLREDPRPSSRRPLRFVPAYLRIHAKTVALQGVRYRHANGMELVAQTVQGAATITAGNLRVPQFKIDGERFDAQGTLRLRARRPLQMELTAEGHLRLPNNPPLALKAQLGGNVEALTIKAQLREPAVANAEVLLTWPQQRWRIAGHVGSPAFSLEPWLQRPPLSLRRVALQVDASAQQIRIDGTVVVPELDDNALSVAARGSFAARTLDIDAADITLHNAPGRLLASGTLVFDGAAPTLDLAARWTDLQWPLRAAALVHSRSGELLLKGSLPYDFRIAANASGPRFPALDGTASGVLTKEAITLASYSLSVLQGSLTGQAALRFAQPREWSFSTRAAALNPAPLLPDIPGTLSFLAEGRGAGLNKDARFSLSLQELRGMLRDQPVRGQGLIARDAKGWRVENGDLRYGDARLTLDGALGDTVDARWSFSAPALQRLLPQASGALAFSGTAGGALKTPQVAVRLDGSDLRYRQWSARRLALNADIDMSGRNPSRLTASAARLGQTTALLESLKIAGAGTPVEHRLTIDATGVPSGSDAPPHGVMVVAGKLERQVWNATISAAQITMGEPAQQIALADPATLVLSQQRASLDNFCLSVAAGRLCASGKWERNGLWESTIAGYEIPLAVLLPPSGDEAEYAGRIEGRVHVTGLPGKPWQGEAGMRIVDAAIIYTPQGAEPETLQLGTGGLAATATAERVEFSFGVQAFTDTFLYANARLQRDGSNDLLHVPLTGDIRGRVGDANILPLVFPDIDHAAGVLTGNANIAGTLAMPEVNGRIELANGEFDSYRINLALRQISLAAAIASNSLSFNGNGRAGDGRLGLDGRFHWREGRSSGVFNLRGTNLLVADLPAYRVVASPDLRFQIEDNRIDASGDVTIPNALVQPARLTGAVRTSDDAHYADEHEAEQAGRFVVHGDIRVLMGDDVRVDAFGLQGRIEGGVTTMTQTGQDPVGRGELSVAEGRYEAYGQKLDINRGRLLFEASPLDDPGLDIEARRKIETVTVGLNVRGTLQAPRITFFSDPSLPQTQIVSYLLGGKPTDGASGGDALAAQGGGLLAAQLGRRLGLEEVGVESSTGASGATNTALVLGKFLSPRLFISYGISLTESINTLKLRYTLSDKWILKTEAGEHQSADVEYTIER